MIWLETSDTSSLVEVMKSLIIGKKKPKAIEIPNGILKYLTKEWETLSAEDAENDKDTLKIYEGNFKDWGLLIIILIVIPVGLVRQCYENEHEYWNKKV